METLQQLPAALQQGADNFTRGVPATKPGPTEHATVEKDVPKAVETKATVETEQAKDEPQAKKKPNRRTPVQRRNEVRNTVSDIAKNVADGSKAKSRSDHGAKLKPRRQAKPPSGSAAHKAA